MKYHGIYCKDVNTQNWIFNQDDDDRVWLNPAYRDLQCPKCKKIDEIKAMKRGLVECHIEETKADYFGTHDGMICVSARFKTVLSKIGVKDIDYYPIPRKGREYYVFVPTRRVWAKRSFFKYGRKCVECGRYKTVYGGPSSLEMKLPDEPNVVCIMDIPPEKEGGIMLAPMAGEDVVKALKAAKLTGILPVRIYP